MILWPNVSKKLLTDTEGQHAITGRALLGKLVCLVGIQFHQ